jgi:NAD(P)-dependent dehydrogenase (short-subunit alcohol dehydrogenase family)
MSGLMLTGLDGKVAVVTGAGRMRSIGRPIAVELAQAGCDVVLTGTGRSPDRYPDDEKEAGWRDIDSVADEVRSAASVGRRQRRRRRRRGRTPGRPGRHSWGGSTSP